MLTRPHPESRARFQDWRSLIPLGNDGVGTALLDKAGKFGTAIGDAGIKAETIQLEQRLEVALIVVAQGEHGNRHRHGVRLW